MNARLGSTTAVRPPVILDRRLQDGVRAWLDAERVQPVHEVLGEIDAQLGRRNGIRWCSSAMPVERQSSADASTVSDSHVVR